MAEYGVDIALRVTGEERFNKVLRAVGQLENRIKSINAIDITAPGAGKLGDDVRKALAPFRDLARESVNTGNGLKNTQARMQAVAESFRFLSSNAKIGSADFRNFTIAADNQSRALQKVALEQENIIRASRGMQSVEERQIQLARRYTLLLELRRKRQQELNLEEAASRGGPRSPIGGSASIPGSPAFIARQRREALSSGLIGGAFPLLFGQGVGAAVGGGLGGGLGGLAGGQLGFGLSLVGTALGSVFDQLANQARDTAKALKDPITAFDQVKQKALLSSAAQERFVQSLISSGQITRANAEIQREIVQKIGTQGVKNFQSLGAASEKFNRAFGEFTLQLQAALAGPLAGLTSWLAGFIAAANTATSSRMLAESSIPTNPTQRKAFEQEVLKSYNKVFGTQFTSVSQGRGQLEGSSGFLGYLSGSSQGRQELARIQEMFPSQDVASKLSAEAAQRQKVETGTTQLMQRQADLARAQLVLSTQNLSVNKQGYAAAATNVNTLEYEIRKLEIKNQMIQEGFNLERNQALHRQAALQYQAQQAALAEQLRQQSIADDQARLALAVRSNALLAEETDIYLQHAAIGATQEETLAKRKEYMASMHTLQLAMLSDEHTSVRLSDDFRKNSDIILSNQKQERQNLINRQIVEKNSLLAEEKRLALVRLRAQQERDLQVMQTGTGFISQLARTGVQEQFFGPFGGSAQMQRQAALDFDLEVRAKQFEIQQQIAQLSQTTDKEEIKNIEDRRNQLQQLLNLYTEYQPKINAAAVEQARFNEALQYTQPIVDSVFQSFMDVAEGTRSAQQAFSDFLRGIASMLFDVAKQLIAQYIAIGIARTFAGVPSGGGSANVTQLNAASTQYQSSGITMATFGGPRANGGPVSAGTPYLVGERGPELFMPRTSGSIYPNDAMGMGGSNVVVNVDATGTSVQGNQPDAAQLGRAIGAAVQAELIKQKRPGGLLA